MINNDVATMHLLTQTEQLYFVNKLKEIKERVERIKDEQCLKGNWTLSEDFKWLVKTED